VANGSGRRNRARTRELNSNGRKHRSMANALDKLAEFDLFDQSVMPQLKKMVLEQWTPERIRKNFAPLIQALAVQKALSPGNKQWSAIKDLLDRHEGTAVQRVENKTLYGKMDRSELAALALQKLKDAGIVAIDGRVVNVTKDDDKNSPFVIKKDDDEKA
jgi:hypothetical protein